MKRDTVENSLFSVFRLFAAFRLAFFLLSWLAQRFTPFPRLQQAPVFPFFGITETVLLLVFLSLPWLRKELGKSYLPIALAIATAAPFIENFLNFSINPSDEVVQIGLLNGQWQLFIFLLVPLILVSWQYSFRWIIVYCSSLVILDVASIILLNIVTGQVVLRPISLFIFRTLVFIFVGYIIQKLVTEQRKRNDRLDQANRQLTSYTDTLEQLAISHERNRLAREFHDTLAHILSAVAVQLEAVTALWDNDPAKSRAMLAQSLAETRQGLNETRRAIQALRAAPLEDLGFNLALRNLASSMAERHNLSCEVNIADDLPDLKPETEHALYRVLEEALRNTVKHAQAVHVIINLRKLDHKIVMTIKDDGQGFNPVYLTNGNGKNNHFGLRGMREYADSISANLKIESQSGEGTSITISLEAEDGASINL
jgi:signal transduction histidine kinase